MATAPHPDGARPPAPAAPASRVLFGVPFHDVTFDETVEWCVARMRRGPPSCLATANVDFLMQAANDPELQRILLEADLVVADGQPIVRASRRFGPPLRQRVTGSDLVPLLATACARHRLSLFLLGGAPGVADAAAAALVARNPGLRIAGTYSPPLAGILEMDHAGILARLRRARPHLLLVAFGAPKQEKFINLHLRSWDVPLAIGVGGTLDFLAGKQTRAPRLVQRAGFEWLWRLGTDPRRLFRRYAANIAFLSRTMRRLERLRTEPFERWEPDSPESSWDDLQPSAVPSERYRAFGLGGRDWLDSAQLGGLVDAARAWRRRDGRLLVHGGSARAERLLRATGLADYLEYTRTRPQMRSRLAELEDDGRRGEARNAYGQLVLRLPAEFTAAVVAGWAARVEAAWSRDTHDVFVDAAGVDFLDSAGLGWLVALRRRCTEARIAFGCCGFDGAALQTLRLARVEAFFTVDRSRSEGE